MNAPGPAIEVRALTKTYGPAGLTFSVPRGVIGGFLGPNGSGKTTTMRILMGLARAQGGQAHLLGVPVGSTHEIFRNIAFVAETKALYPSARAQTMIRLTRGFYPNWDHKLEKRLVEEFEIPLKKMCTRLSKGQRTKLALLLALCRNAELLVLDEPTEGLDPLGIEQTLRALVEQTADRGATVFFSSHHLAEVEQIADYVVMIKRGVCAAEGEIDALKERFRRVRCVVESDADVAPALVTGWRRDGRMLTGYSSEDPESLGAALAASGIALLDAEPATLKEIFFERMEHA